MPELPEVETVRRGLEVLTLNHRIVGGEVLWPRTIAYPPVPADFITSLVGQSLLAWERRGKYLLGQLNQRGWLVVHLRMTGQLFWLPQAASLAKHTRIRLFCDQDMELRFVDQRTFGQMWWLPDLVDMPKLMPTLAGLGPEPLGTEFTISYLQKQLQARRRPIKSALLDQALVAGIGNIYADEALFLAGIHPLTLCADLHQSQISALQAKIIHVLQTSLDVGGTTFNTFTSVEGINGNYGGQAWVYSRTGEPCRHCQTSIERLKISGRSSHFCPICQK